MKPFYFSQYLKRGSKLAPLLSVLSLCDCSGTMEVRACLLNGQVAFKLGKVPSYIFFRRTARPHRLWVTKMSAGFRTGIMSMWSGNLRLDAEASQLSIVVYGRQLEGWNFDAAAKPLNKKDTYRVGVSAGPESGTDDFTVASLHPCSQLGASRTKA